MPSIATAKRRLPEQGGTAGIDRHPASEATPTRKERVIEPTFLLVFCKNIVEDGTWESARMNPTEALSQPDEPLARQVGRYRILELLGSGGMGTVYKAHDPHLDRTVAIKLPHFAGPPKDHLRRVQRFQREARMAARIWHRHVCPIYDVGEHEGQPFVVMPFVEGQSLAQRLTDRGRFENIGEAVEIA